jgi:hypothetical protein
MSDFVGWSRDELIQEIIGLRRQLRSAQNRVERILPAAEEHWREEERKRGEQGIFG